MKIFIVLFFSSIQGLSIFSQNSSTIKITPDSTKKIDTLESACGQCQLGLPGTTCDLAVRINGKAYFVDGTTIDAHGNAHAKDGFCNAIRKAEVQGELVDKRFKVNYFKLIAKPETKAPGH